MYNNGDLIGFKYNNQNYYYVKNAQDDIIGILDENYNRIASYEYDSWGNMLSITGNTIVSSINPFRYRSYYYDQKTKLYYLNSRYYNSLWARFLNADGIVGANQDIQAYNTYAYCSNNPLNHMDQSGMFALSSIISVAQLALIFIATATASGYTVNSASQMAKNGKVSYAEAAKNAVKGITAEAGLGFGLSEGRQFGINNFGLGYSYAAYKDFTIGIKNGEFITSEVGQFGVSGTFVNKELSASIGYEHQRHDVILENYMEGNIFIPITAIWACDKTEWIPSFGVKDTVNYSTVEFSAKSTYVGLSGDWHKGIGGHFKLGYTYNY